MFVFQKIWRVFFPCSYRFEICPFSLVTYKATHISLKLNSHFEQCVEVIKFCRYWEAQENKISNKLSLIFSISSKQFLLPFFTQRFSSFSVDLVSPKGGNFWFLGLQIAGKCISSAFSNCKITKQSLNLH